MVGLAKSVQYVWALCVGFECVLLVLMLTRKQYRSFPAFFSYLIVDIQHSLSVFVVYQIWGFRSFTALYFSWASQGIVLCARAVAVAELCRHLLKAFRGIWELAWRLLILCAVIVASVSAAKAGWIWYETLLRMNVGLELAMIATIVCLFLFARYYEIFADRTLQIMGVGFLLLSCAKVVNDTILQQRLRQYMDLWRMSGELVFLACLSLWFWALYQFAPAPARKPVLLPPDIYDSLAPKINERLRELNEQLKRFWHVKAQRS